MKIMPFFCFQIQQLKRDPKKLKYILLYCIYYFKNMLKSTSLFILLLIISKFCISQDSLSKYSYFFFGYTDQCKVINGQPKCRVVKSTCFLVRKANKLYLVSAAHSLFNLNHTGQTPPPYIYPTRFYLRVFTKGNHLADTLPFNVPPKPASDYFLHNVDAYAIEIKIPNRYIINTVDKFFFKISDNSFRKSIEAVMYGYLDKQGVENLQQPAMKCTFNPNSYWDSISITENQGESDAGLVKLEGEAEAGNSGSPLFLISGKAKIIFGGLCFATNNGKVFFIRPADVLKKIP